MTQKTERLIRHLGIPVVVDYTLKDGKLRLELIYDSTPLHKLGLTEQEFEVSISLSLKQEMDNLREQEQLNIKKAIKLAYEQNNSTQRSEK